MDSNNTNDKDCLTKVINNMIENGNEVGWSAKDISDRWHTFEEMYYQRMVLFLSLQLAHKSVSWKAKRHNDGTMFIDYFIVGIETPKGQYTYHYKIKFWDLFKDIRELDRAPRYDGHKSSDIDRLLSLYKNN